MGEKPKIAVTRCADLETTIVRLEMTAVVGNEELREVQKVLEKVDGNLVLDLTEVKVADGGLLGKMAVARNMAASEGYAMALVNPPPGLLSQIFCEEDFRAFFENRIYESVPSALDAFHAAMMRDTAEPFPQAHRPNSSYES